MALFVVATGSGYPAVAVTPKVAGWPAGRPASYMLRYNDPNSSAAEAPRRRIVALNAWEWPAIARIKAANPDALVLVYKDLSSTRDSVPCSSNQDDLPTGVDYCSANTTHPDWFLTDSAGKRLRYDAWPDSWQMDVGNPAYQQTWLDNVRAGLAARRWDGVFLDNALTTADAYHAGVTSPRYPTNKSIQSAYRTFLTKIGNGLHHFTMANATNSRPFPGLWKDYIAPLDAGFDEFFVDSSATPNGSYLCDCGPNEWMAQIKEIADSEASGKVAVVRSGLVDSTADSEGFKYSLGSYLLANGGHSMFAFSGNYNWHPAFEWNLGAAIGAFHPVENHTYRRDFSSGTVIVNASEGSTVTIPLGESYLDEDSRAVNSVTLGPQRAAILRQQSAQRRRPAR